MLETSSDEFDVLKNSHIVISRAEIYDSHDSTLIVSSSTGDGPMKIIDGSVKGDRKASHRRTFSLTILDEDNAFTSKVDEVPERPTDPIYRHIIRLYRGFIINGVPDYGTAPSWPGDPGDDPGITPVTPADGDITEWELGHFMVEDVSTNESAQGVVTITMSGRDISALVADNPWTEPYQVLKDTNIADAISDILTDRMPSGMSFATDIGTTSEVVPVDMTFGGYENYDNNPWQEAQNLAEGAGWELYVDQTGTFCAGPVPYLDLGTADADATYAEGTGSLLLNLETAKVTQLSSIYNGVIVKVNAPWLLTPIQAEHWVTTGTMARPNFQRPFIIERSVITSLAQAQTLCDNKYDEIVGKFEQINFSAMPVPGHEPGDFLQVTIAAQNIDQLMILESFEMPLCYDRPAQLNCARKREV